jgi:hypothetical protein
LKEILEEKVLLDAASEGNRWFASWAFWMLSRRGMAVKSLIVSLPLSIIFLNGYRTDQFDSSFSRQLKH